MKNRADLLGGLFCAALGAGFCAGALRLHIGTATEPQPGFFPFFGGAALVALAAILFSRAWQGKGERASFGDLRRPAALVASLVVYLVTLNVLGYVIATSVLAVAVLKILDTPSWGLAIGIGTGLSVGTYLLFDRLLGMGLPQGVLARLG
jgi:putative tricarboxylic transport membrane protein